MRPAPIKPSSLSEEQCTIRLTRQDLDDLLRALEQGEAKKDARRAHTRLRYHLPFVRARVPQTGATLLLACRNISRGGMGLLHCAYMHPQTICYIHLQEPSGTVCEVKGKVAHCRHVAGRVHEVGLSFDVPISVRRFLKPDPFSEQYSLETFDTAQMRGRVLLLTDCPYTRRMIEHWLRETRVTLESPASLDDAYAATKGEVDVILMDYDAKGLDAVALTDRMRLDGVHPPIILISGDASLASRRRMMAVKAAGFLSKPLSDSMLLRALGEFLVLSDPTAGSTNSRTSAPEQGEFGGVAQEFAQELTKIAGELRQAVAGDDFAAFNRACTHIRSVAPVLGFNAIATAATNAVGRVAQGSSLASAQREIFDLIALCERAQAA